MHISKFIRKAAVVSTATTLTALSLLSQADTAPLGSDETQGLSSASSEASLFGLGLGIGLGGAGLFLGIGLCLYGCIKNLCCENTEDGADETPLLQHMEGEGEGEAETVQ